jgi:hypothetical protein
LNDLFDVTEGSLPMLQLLQRLRLPSVVALEIVVVLLSAYFLRLSGVWLYIIMGFLFVGGAVCLAYSVRNETYKSFGWGLTLGIAACLLFSIAVGIGWGSVSFVLPAKQWIGLSTITGVVGIMGLVFLFTPWFSDFLLKRRQPKERLFIWGLCFVVPVCFVLFPCVVFWVDDVLTSSQFMMSVVAFVGGWLFTCGICLVVLRLRSTVISWTATFQMTCGPIVCCGLVFLSLFLLAHYIRP